MAATCHIGPTCGLPHSVVVGTCHQKNSIGEEETCRDGINKVRLHTRFQPLFKAQVAIQLVFLAFMAEQGFATIAATFGKEWARSHWLLSRRDIHKNRTITDPGDNLLR